MNFFIIVIPTNDIGLIKVDRDGNVLWEKKYESIVDDTANKVIETPDGYLVVGDTNSYDDQGQARPASYFDSTKSMGMDLTGTYNFYLMKVGPDGKKAWSKAFGGKGFDSATDVIGSGDGNYIIAGITDAGRAYNAQQTDGDPYYNKLMDACLLKITPDGSLIWGKTYGSNDRLTLTPS